MQLGFNKHKEWQSPFFEKNACYTEIVSKLGIFVPIIFTFEFFSQSLLYIFWQFRIFKEKSYAENGVNE